jgi:dissimilatory sulfite reductase (desulfoviridin) alpha/beta subunit
MCSGCAEECEEGVIFTEKKGYKVVAGGTGARCPHIAKTVSEFTDLEGVLKILEKAINMMKDTPVDGRVIEFHDVVEKHGIEKFRI